MKLLEDIAYGDDAAQKLDIYLPDGEVASVFVYFHGGGLHAGDKNSAERYANYLTQRGVVLISANYRMYPDARYPDFICDAAQVVAWANKYMHEELGCDRLYVGGSSAGGYMTMMLCFDKRYLAQVGLDNSAIAGYLHNAGQPTAHFYVLEQNGVDKRRLIVDETAPLYYVGLEEKYPPMRFIVSDNDMKNRYEQTMLMLSTMQHFGYEDFDHVVVPGKHCSQCKAVDEKGDSVMGKLICSFIESVENKMR